MTRPAHFRPQHTRQGQPSSRGVALRGCTGLFRHVLDCFWPLSVPEGRLIVNSFHSPARGGPVMSMAGSGPGKPAPVRRGFQVSSGLLSSPVHTLSEVLPARPLSIHTPSSRLLGWGTLLSFFPWRSPCLLTPKAFAPAIPLPRRLFPPLQVPGSLSLRSQPNDLFSGGLPWGLSIGTS